ncbi:MAG: hypothetical protein FWD33_00545 [Alphaproteobacteria bacterium]|nr:hypothetical protein [Alphaproteobacteria bacterium]
MNFDELKSELVKYGAKAARPAPDELVRTQAALQGMGKLMMPAGLVEFFQNFGAVVLGDAEIFAPMPAAIGKMRTRTIIEVNGDMSASTPIGGKTVFGRNQLFWLVVGDDFKFHLLDLYTMRPAKAYDDVNLAVRDCLLVGAL